MIKSKNSNQKQITIQSVLSIPLEVLVKELLDSEDNPEFIISLLKLNTKSVISLVSKIVNDFMILNSSDIKVVSIKFSYCDSKNITHGSAVFEVVLKGKEKSLRRIAGEDGFLYFDWGEHYSIS